MAYSGLKLIVQGSKQNKFLCHQVLHNFSPYFSDARSETRANIYVMQRLD